MATKKKKPGTGKSPRRSNPKKPGRRPRRRNPDTFASRAGKLAGVAAVAAGVAGVAGVSMPATFVAMGSANGATDPTAMPTPSVGIVRAAATPMRPVAIGIP